MYKIVYVTTVDEKEAEEIANTLVEEKLSACANILPPINSIYRWKGKIERDNEVAIFLKTKAELVEDVIKRVKELHSYDVPCIISLPIEKGYTEYLKWIDESTRRPM